MSINCLPLCLKEESNLLDPAWIAGGQRILKSIKTVKQRKNDKSIVLESVDIVASCNKVQYLINNSQELRRCQLLAQPLTDVSTKSKDKISFRCLARLSFGLSNIFSQQVDNLLGDAKNLLNEMKSCGNIFDVPSKATTTQKRKRKNNETKQSKIKRTKQSRTEETEESEDNYCPNEYTNMLGECLEWNNIKLSTEFARMCQMSNMREQNMIIQDVIYNEDPRDFTLLLDENDGFGDTTPDDISFTIIEELYPNRSLKRSAQVDLSDILCQKRPRLDTTLEEAVADNCISHDNIQMSSDCTYQELVIPEQLMPPVRLRKLPKKKKKKYSKLIIDECIKYSRQSLLEHREHYLEQFKAVNLTRPKIPKEYPTVKELLSGRTLRNQKHKSLEGVLTLPQHEVDTVKEYTLRAIFGSDYNDNLAKEIYWNPSTQSSEEILLPMLLPSNQEEELEQPIPCIPITFLPEPQISLSQETNSNNNNNNNNDEKDNQNPISAFNVMMLLLSIWRNNPDKKITANKFMKNFPNHQQIASVFSYLLVLSRDRYILITKIENTLEMNKILMGSETISLIEEISQGDQTF